MAKPRPIELSADLSYGEAAARAIIVRAEEVAQNADGALDTGEIERMHDLRVATRRLLAVCLRA